jgi:5-formyltetrahydrofolate cyclo-ligase
VTRSVGAAKVRLRALVRERLALVPAAERERRSARIAASLEGSPEVCGASRLLLHRSLPSEVAIDPLLASALQRGQLVFAPRIDGKHLDFVRIEFETSWQRSTFGVLEPTAGSSLRLEELAEDETVIVVPGLAFDARGGRLGRGGGHYDRFLAAARGAGSVLAIAAAFETQVVTEVPTESHDQRVDRIVTEERVLAC